MKRIKDKCYVWIKDKMLPLVLGDFNEVVDQLKKSKQTFKICQKKENTLYLEMKSVRLRAVDSLKRGGSLILACGCSCGKKPSWMVWTVME